ncbi:MAG: PDZ domain-containing protein [Propionibacteriaceae bacterium]|jgi:PDZ domain-containing protein|nr:PDZ domain-containing protein [Propionibacteriaceae bacterium]
MRIRQVVSAAALSVLLLLVILLVPTPYTIWSPGDTYNYLGEIDGKPVIEIEDEPVDKPTGQLLLATVGTTGDRNSNLLSVALSQLSQAQEVLPADSVVNGDNPRLVNEPEPEKLVIREDNAVVAALRQADRQIIEHPQITVVAPSGPANNILQVGDLVTQINQDAVSTQAQAEAAIADLKVGDTVRVKFIRDKEDMDAIMIVQATSRDSKIPTLGLQFTTSYSHDEIVNINKASNPEGLMLSLAIYDMLTEGELTGGQIVAGAGRMSVSGEVGSVDGIRQRIAAAKRDGARYFIIPSGNCSQVASDEGLTLVRASTLADSIENLQAALSGKVVKGCE